MTWKKNAFSYIVWVVYLFLLSIVIGVFVFELNYTNIYVLIGLTCLGLLVPGCIYLGVSFTRVHRRKRNAKYVSQKDNHFHTGYMIEGILAVGLLAAGMLLRINFISYGTEEAAYYEIAEVVSNTTIPVIAHGAQYIYVLLLHGMFLLVGNHFFAGIILQIILQLISTILLYFVVRKIAGPIAGIFVMAFTMLLPQSIVISLTYSPKVLYGLLCTMWLFFAELIGTKAILSETKKAVSIVQGIAIGIFLGVLVYLDMIGSFLIIFLVGYFFLKQKEGNSKKILLGISSIGATIISFIGLIKMDAISSNASFLKVLTTWSQLFSPKEFDVMNQVANISMDTYYLILIGIILFVLSLGIFSFWNDPDIDIQGIWIIAFIILTIYAILGLPTKAMTTEYFTVTILVILAGIGLQKLFTGELPVIKAFLKEEAGESMAEEVIREEVIREEEPKKVTYIENPLPLPKQHVKKAMDYHILVEKENMGYDIEVSADDDYDLK